MPFPVARRFYGQAHDRPAMLRFTIRTGAGINNRTRIGTQLFDEDQHSRDFTSRSLVKIDHIGSGSAATHACPRDSNLLSVTCTRLSLQWDLPHTLCR